MEMHRTYINTYRVVLFYLWLTKGCCIPIIAQVIISEIYSLLYEVVHRHKRVCCVQTSNFNPNRQIKNVKFVYQAVSNKLLVCAFTKLENLMAFKGEVYMDASWTSENFIVICPANRKLNYVCSGFVSAPC